MKKSMRSHDDPVIIETPVRGHEAGPKRRVLWVGDSPTVATGFGRATGYTVQGLIEAGFEVEVLGMHYRGDPYKLPYDIWPTKYDMLGAKRLPERCAAFKPDVIVIQNDVWNVPYYVRELRKAKIATPVVAALAIDGLNCQSQKLDGVSLAIFWTKFAEEEAKIGGYIGPTAVVPLGVDLSIYSLEKEAHVEPLRVHARTLFDAVKGSPIDMDAFKKGFVVANVNRNQQRKRLDLTVQCFCEWVHEKSVADAFLMIQACPTGEYEYDVPQLMEYYGLADRLFYITPHIEDGVAEKDLVWTYRCADVGLTTTQGEGFGLTTFEMMACGIPMIVPAWSGLDEICENAAIKVPCTGQAATQGGVNVIGGVIDKAQTIEALDLVYRRPDLRQELTARGLAVVRQDRYRWPNIGAAFAKAINDAIFPVAASYDDEWDALTKQEQTA